MVDMSAMFVFLNPGMQKFCEEKRRIENFFFYRFPKGVLNTYTFSSVSRIVLLNNLQKTEKERERYQELAPIVLNFQDGSKKRKRG